MVDAATGLPRRILKETQKLQEEPVQGISCVPFEDNRRHFFITLAGPKDTPYEGGVFRLELFLPADYPMAPPKPNIDKLGRICLDILKSKWSPALQIRTVLLSIQALLSTPEPSDPLDTTVADHWTRDQKGAEETARAWTEKFAKA